MNLINARYLIEEIGNSEHDVYGKYLRTLSKNITDVSFLP